MPWEDRHPLCEITPFGRNMRTSPMTTGPPNPIGSNASWPRPPRPRGSESSAERRTLQPRPLRSTVRTSPSVHSCSISSSVLGLAIELDEAEPELGIGYVGLIAVPSERVITWRSTCKITRRTQRGHHCSSRSLPDGVLGGLRLASMAGVDLRPTWGLLS
jgi:hypothetical protein